LSKRRKSKAHRRSCRGKNKRKRDFKEGSKDHESINSKRDSADSNDSDETLLEERKAPRSIKEFKARQHKQDMLFVIFIVILGAGMFGGYFLYNNAWPLASDDNVDDGSYDDIIAQNNSPNDQVNS
jgi:hypothetical protein